MAFSSVGSLGTASVKETGYNLSMSPSRDVAAGQLVVIWVAWDSIYSVFADSDGTERFSISDYDGNIYCTLGGETDTQGFYNEGAFCGIFISQLRSPLTTSSVITVSGENDILKAKAMSMWEFSIASGMRWAGVDTNREATATIGGDPPSSTLTVDVSQEHLWLHGLGVEGPNSDTYTWDGAFTEIDADGTTGGSDTANIHIRGGWKISTDNSVTVNVSSDTADRDNTQVLTAVCEVQPQPFPTTPILDNFNRANEEPLDNGTWDTTNAAGPSSPGTRLMKLTSNQAAAGSTAAGGQFWAASFANAVEAYVSIPTWTAGEIDVHFHTAGASQLATLDGSGVAWKGNDPQAIGTYLDLGRSGDQGGIAHSWVVRAWVSGANGYKLGIQRTPAGFGGQGVDHAWVDLGSGWEEVSALFLGRTDQRISGLLAMAVWDSTARLDDFGGGEFIEPFIPQVYRRVFG